MVERVVVSGLGIISCLGNDAGSVRDALLVVLTSPQFLFLIEKSDTPDPEPLEPYELASKLSYFLWDAAPDAQLLVEVLEGMSAQLELQNSELSAHNELLKRQIGVLSNGRGRSATASPAPSAFSSS